MCYMPCHPCQTTEIQVLDCGHENEVPCSSNNIPLKCNFQVEKSLACGHIVQASCGELNVKCDKVCEFLLPDCEHKCGLKCHNDHNPSR